MSETLGNNIFLISIAFAFISIAIITIQIIVGLSEEVNIKGLAEKGIKNGIPIFITIFILGIIAYFAGGKSKIKNIQNIIN